VILILAAIWLGCGLPNACRGPSGGWPVRRSRLARAIWTPRCPKSAGDDEIAMLGRMFNQMTRQLKRQREALLEKHPPDRTARRLFDSVLSSVTAGVIGLDSEGRVTFVNRRRTPARATGNRGAGRDMSGGRAGIRAAVDRLARQRR
jgi:two-component system, NtrC family, nitrogen regulation sensor histidine kinase NtrY